MVLLCPYVFRWAKFAGLYPQNSHDFFNEIDLFVYIMAKSRNLNRKRIFPIELKLKLQSCKYKLHISLAHLITEYLTCSRYSAGNLWFHKFLCLNIIEERNCGIRIHPFNKLK